MSTLINKLVSNRIFLRLLNVGIRGGTVLGRFVLIMFLAKFLPEADLGSFGIFVATALMCTLLLSFEFNKYMYRELFAHAEVDRARILGSHVKTIGCLYILGAPMMYCIFYFKLIGFEYALYFYAVVFLVLVSLELEALLVVLGNQLISSFVFFIQTSAWVFFVIPTLYLFPSYRSIEFIYVSWVGGASLSICVALCFLWVNKIRIEFNGMGGEWIKNGLRKSSIFLLSSLMLKLLLTIDRYTMEFYSTTELVGVYVFYVSVVMGVFNFLESAVFSFIYPRLLRYYKDGNHVAFKSAHRELVFSTLVGVALVAIFLSYLVPYLVNALGLHAYTKNLDDLWLIILASAAYMLGFIPHYVLYSRGQFNWLSYSNATALLAFLLSICVLSTHSTISLVASSLLIAFSVGGGVKLYGAYVISSERIRYDK